jgi:hypothetical protein
VRIESFWISDVRLTFHASPKISERKALHVIELPHSHMKHEPHQVILYLISDVM